MTIQAIERMLQASTGLDPESMGRSAIYRALRERMAHHALESEEAYLERLRLSPAELDELIEETVVGETWFFRSPRSFDYLRHYLATRSLNGQRPLRALSLGCATGEEVYTLAMTLLEGGVTSEEFSVVGVDISRRFLDVARRGIYRGSSFRGEELAFRDRFLVPCPEGYQLRPDVMEAARLIRGNALDPSLLPGQGSFEVVFCRNLLIYLDPPSRRKLLANLERLIMPEGLLFIGFAEASQVPQESFTPLRWSGAFVFQRKTRPNIPPPSPPEAWEPRARPPSPPLISPPELKEGTALPSPPPTSKALARQLADQGQLEEAQRVCQGILASECDDAEVYCLLGLVHQAKNDLAAAEANFRKAVYLSPDFHEALVHLYILLEHKGEHSESRFIRQRAERLEARES